MADQAKLSGARVLLMIQFAALLQLLVMLLLAVDRIKVAVAIPLLALVLIVGLIPAAAFVKSNK